MRNLSKTDANLILQILIEECGYKVLDPRDGQAFVHSIIGKERATREYRFQGALGFGGKFRNNGNHENTPYVDCYQEDETPARNAMIAAANKRLAALFNSVSEASS